MHCPDCNGDRTRVIDTAPSTDAVRRRRECQRCGFRFTTYERPEWDTQQVKKRDGTLEPFDTAKLRTGIERAVEKRPVTDEAVTDVVNDVQDAIANRDTQIVASSLIGELVSEQLRAIDQVAYIRFVSVYKAFSEPEEFLDELDAVLEHELRESDGRQSHES